MKRGCCHYHKHNALRLLSLVIAVILSFGATPGFANEKVEVVTRPKVALALGGGGTRGAAHVGVLRVLVEEKIPIDMITGTSMGAIVGGLFAAGLTVDQIQAQFSKQTLMKHYMTVPIPVRMAAIPFFAIPHLFGWHPYDGFYFGNELRNYLESCLPPDRRTVESLKIPFHAMSMNLVSGQPYVISRGNLARAMQASSAVPVLRRPVPMEDGSLLVDGAVVANVPVTIARDMGADIIIAVDVDERLVEVSRDEFRKIGSVGKRVEQVFLARADALQISKADFVIHPKVDGIGLLSTKIKDAREAIKAGEEAARAALPEIRAKLGLTPATVSQPRDYSLPN